MLKPLQLSLLALLAVAPVAPVQAQQVGPGVPAFSVRPGYRVTLAAQEFGEARFLERDGDTLFVSQPGEGRIVAMKRNANGTFGDPKPFVSDKSRVHAMHFVGGYLWFATSGAIFKARDTNGDRQADEVQTIIPDGQLPEGGGHWQRSLCVTDDGFFTSIGDSGNISDETNTDRQKVWKYSLDGQNRELWATGLRNTEKLRLHPTSGDLFGADHGSDNLGARYGEGGANGQPITDALPPCEFNRYEKGSFYGHPFIVGPRIVRPEFADKDDIVQLAARTTVPAWNFGAHWAPNGWTFATQNSVVSPGDAVVANHGSWNSSRKVGYRLERVMFDRVTNLPMGALQLVSTLTPDGNDVLGKPVDVVEDADGTLLWSCDQTNKVYRLSRAR